MPSSPTSGRSFREDVPEALELTDDRVEERVQPAPLGLTTVTGYTTGLAKNHSWTPVGRAYLKSR